eukprot:NODE_21879_length_732_cov_4.557025.p2 GENE.NODE_21879_length_732_cov_4.557025~~NODE_21879_length_732_cov_4.557025.p2  ORF type:complete len:141 (-),score=46.99 NODE_21879_length_732_cov_4.557025:257-679(-)
MADASIAAKRSAWNACLGKSGGNPMRCERVENELRVNAKAVGVDCCIDETLRLMRCTNTHRGGGCGFEFVNMRECNRQGGRHLSSDLHGFTVDTGKQNLFVRDNMLLVSSTAPQRTLESMTEYGKEYAAKLGITDGACAF